MEDKWYSLRCRVALAQELEIPPDDLDITPVLNMMEKAYLYEKDGEYTVNIFPDTREEEKAVINNHYGTILTKIFNNEAPFQGFIEHIMFERGII